MQRQISLKIIKELIKMIAMKNEPKKCKNCFPITCKNVNFHYCVNDGSKVYPNDLNSPVNATPHDCYNCDICDSCMQGYVNYCYHDGHNNKDTWVTSDEPMSNEEIEYYKAVIEGIKNTDKVLNEAAKDPEFVAAVSKSQYNCEYKDNPEFKSELKDEEVQKYL